MHTLQNKSAVFVETLRLDGSLSHLPKICTGQCADDYSPGTVVLEAKSAGFLLIRSEVMDLVLDVHDSQGNARPLRSAGIPGESWFRKGCKIQKDAEFIVVLCLEQSKHDGM